MYIFQYLCDDPEISEWYKIAVSHVDDSGFDLFIPEDVSFQCGETKIVDLKIKGKMVEASGKEVAYTIYPRSSICKTPLILANSIGMIDVGYRNTLKIALKYIPTHEDYANGFTTVYTVPKGTRLVQAIAPNVQKFAKVQVQSFEISERNLGGFGSTGTSFAVSKNSK